MDLTALLLSRLQFAFTIPPLTGDRRPKLTPLPDECFRLPVSVMERVGEGC
jgi:hypothetical protein